MSMSRHTTAVLMLAMCLGAPALAAQDAAADAETARKSEPPASPIFFGQAYEGEWDPADGLIAEDTGESHFTVNVAKFARTFLQIDLFKDEEFSHGLHTETGGGMVMFFVWTTGKDGRPRLRHIPEMNAFAYPGQNCTWRTRAPEAGRYWIRLRAPKPESGGRFRYFITGDAARKSEQCDGKLPSFARAYFEGPAIPVPAAVPADDAQRGGFVPTIAPVIHRPEPSSMAVQYAAGKPEALRPYYEALYMGGEHNAVLNFERLGLVAMQAGEYAAAEWAFDEALSRIEHIYGSNSVADAARSKWVKEAIKDFKGEPYERAMAFYYRGLLYLREGDYENARAAFKAGEFQDTLSEVEQFQGDFALMNYLAGWASRCAGNAQLAAGDFDAAIAVNPTLRRPGAKDNTLVLADLGRGPVKLARGGGRAFLTFVDAVDNGADEHAKMSVATTAGDRTLAMTRATDVFFQATTRGGRAFDAILEGKAAVKSRAGNTVEAGAWLMASNVMPLQVVGTLIALGGKGVEKQVMAEADARVWDTLPRQVDLGITHTNDHAKFRLEIENGPSDAGGGALTTMQARDDRCAIVWGHSRPALDAGAGVPGLNPALVRIREKNREARAADEAFRAALLASDGAGPQGDSGGE